MSTHDDELLDRLADRLADRLNPAPPPNPMIESLTAATTNTAVDGEHLTATVSQAVGHHADPEETARPDLRDPLARRLYDACGGTQTAPTSGRLDWEALNDSTAFQQAVEGQSPAQMMATAQQFADQNPGRFTS
jgi:hypothetical protein